VFGVEVRRVAVANVRAVKAHVYRSVNGAGLSLCIVDSYDHVLVMKAAKAVHVYIERLGTMD
jgi:hypothetical protein